MSAARLTFLLCLAEVLSMTSFAAFPALTPFFFKSWGLSGTQAGWINGAYFCGFTIVGFVAATLTDRIDARKVVLAGNLVAIAGAYGFAVFADGFLSSLPWRFLSGAALAASYMPGLKLLTDRLPEGNHSRSIAFYTACFSSGSALSFLLVGQIHKWMGAETALYAVIAGPPCALLIILLATGSKPNHHPRPWRQLFNFTPVLTNRKTMGYVLAYFCHSWELMAMRSFVVAFLTFAQTRTEAPAWMDISIIASIIIFLGLPASVSGNELALKLGRQKAIALIMFISFCLSLVLGFSADLPFAVVVLLAAAFGFFVTADSSSITSGAVETSPPELKGSTMAVHSFLGFTGAMAGPVVAGVVLDLGGGPEELVAWGFAYLSMGAIAVFAPIALKLSR
ncbi:MFS transporter [Sneathiella sp.]|jgi:MFS family permease|uniref:MFS transporter n=1 Tax=Sneathiella sp. TaxID=1964365 RepID=UPI0039E67C8D